jgi:hypothetical protein
MRYVGHMETMQLITTSPPEDLTALDDASIAAFFAGAGLAIEVVDHCPDASCPTCFGRRPAKAA